MKRFSSQPVCNTCWDERNPDRKAVRRNQGPEEQCCYCNQLTWSGIYVRVETATVPFPQED